MNNILFWYDVLLQVFKTDENTKWNPQTILYYTLTPKKLIIHNSR